MSPNVEPLDTKQQESYYSLYHVQIAVVGALEEIPENKERLWLRY